jgi:DNA-binding MarR family transcriptional regulator
MNDPDSPNKPEATPLLQLLSHSGHIADNQLDAALAHNGLSIAKLGVLKVLAANEGPLALGQIAERLACVRSNVTQLVDSMEAGGLVKRMPDPADRRSIRAALTEEGRRKHATGLEVEKEMGQKLFDRLSADAQNALRDLLGQFSDNSGSMK